MPCQRQTDKRKTDHGTPSSQFLQNSSSSFFCFQNSYDSSSFMVEAHIDSRRGVHCQKTYGLSETYHLCTVSNCCPLNTKCRFKIKSKIGSEISWKIGSKTACFGSKSAHNKLDRNPIASSIPQSLRHSPPPAPAPSLWAR